MPLTDHAPAPLRRLFAAASLDPRALLNRTQRAAIQHSLEDLDWVPDPVALPETTAAVAEWYEHLQPTTQALFVRTKYSGEE